MRQSSSIGVTSGRAIQGCGALLLVAVAACEPMERTAGVVDCAAENSIEYNVPLQTGETRFGFAWEDEAALAGTLDENNNPVYPADSNFYCFADPTINGYPATAPWPSAGGCALPLVKPIEGGGFCQPAEPVTGAALRHRTALHIQAGNHLFWGGTFGTWNLNTSGARAQFPLTGSTDTTDLPADGIAFWARRELHSDSQIVVFLNDETTADTGGICMPAEATDSAQQQGGTAAAVDPNLQTNSGATTIVKDPSACGNRWRADLEISEDWQLITLPFSDFYKEEVQPNRGTEPLDPKLFYSLQFVFLRGQTISMWFDEMALYRNK